MTPRGSGPRKANRAEATKYLGKAVEFLEVAREARKEDRRTAATTLAVHAGISACDAIAVVELGSKWSGLHDGAVKHVKAAPLVGKEAARHLSRLHNVKSRAEYDPVAPSSAAATSALKSAERLVELAGAAVHRK
ncbi:MAG: hypothetical protein ACRDZR_02195 [Acidimicrobiales bacterium]